MNLKIEAENGLTAAFQFWKLPKVITRLDKVMVDFLYDLKDHDINPEKTSDSTRVDVITRN